MRRMTRTSLLAVLCVAAVMVGSGAGAQNYIDTTLLPRADGVRMLRVHPASTSFITPGTVADAEEAYRKILNEAGWQQIERLSAPHPMPTRIMRFRKGTHGLSVFIMPSPTQGGATSVNYTAEVEPADLPSTQAAAAPAPVALPELKSPAPAQAAPVVTMAQAPAVAPGQAASEELEVEESNGLPMPKRHIASSTTHSSFRQALRAEMRLDLAAVLDFYRRELAKRGWKENDGAVVKADEAVLTFTTAGGPAQLRLARKDGKTVVDLAVRKPDAAEKAGMLPTATQARLVLGNMTDEEAVITIDAQTIKVEAGAGRNSPGGPKLDVPPGKHTFTVKLASRVAQTREIEVGADETWGLLVGRGGVLPLQLY